ncbi:MAG: permease prefix domain 1-containing protein [Candidatus Nanopelagicales bacterium]
MTQLVDRYVSATARHVPEDQRPDVVEELRASIEDAVEARTAQGADPETAERDVLTSLGDPELLAAGLSGRSLHLIGPRLYVGWSRVLRAMLVVVVPIVAVVVAVVSAARGETVGSVIGSSVWTSLAVTVHLCFWVTLVFAVLERTGTPATSWDLDQLPPDTPRTVRLAETAWTIAMLALLIVVVLGQRTWSWVTDAAGQPLPVLSPALWTWWMPALIVVVVATMVLQVVLQVRGRWTLGLAHANLVLQLLLAIPLIYLLGSGQLWNPAFFAAAAQPGGAEATSVASTVAMLVVASGAAVQIGLGYRRARAAQADPDAQRPGRIA